MPSIVSSPNPRVPVPSPSDIPIPIPTGSCRPGLGMHQGSSRPPQPPSLAGRGVFCPLLPLLAWFAASVAPFACPQAAAQSFWINEFHYDDTGTDNGEFVEVVGPVDFTDLASVRLTLYNGSDGLPYGSTHTLGTFTPGETVAGLRFYSKQISGLQNGAPDGFSLDVGGTVRQFLSYEGSFTANAGPAAGRTSIDVGFVEGDFTTAGSSIGMVGLGLDSSEFTWSSTLWGSPGGVNDGQAFAAVPEPASIGSVAAVGLLVLGLLRRRVGAAPGQGAGRMH